jgi:hypothetical protein
MIFGVPAIAPGILLLPELTNRLRCVIQPFTIGQQRKQFNGAKKLHCVRVWPAQWPQLARSDKNGNIFRCSDSCIPIIE